MFSFSLSKKITHPILESKKDFDTDKQLSLT